MAPSGFWRRRRPSHTQKVDTNVRMRDSHTTEKERFSSFGGQTTPRLKNHLL
jgi:hypothetical protein